MREELGRAEISDRDLIKSLIHSESDGSDSGHITVEKGEDFVEVDGVKMIPFSLKKDLEDAKFDVRGNLVASSDEGDSASSNPVSDSDEPSSEEADAVEAELLNNLKEIVKLIPPYKNVTEALHNYSNDEAKLSNLSNVATRLLFLGKSKIYIDSIEELEREVSELQRT
jgi:hypothetical protein